MKLRPARPSDADAIRACTEAAYAPYIAVIGKRPAPMDADVDAAIAAGEVVVALYEDALAGYAVFRSEGAWMFLEDVAVTRSGGGIGRALIAHVERVATEAGLDGVWLYTNAAMTANLGLYPHLGYVETHRARQDGFARVFFEKRLRTA